MPFDLSTLTEREASLLQHGLKALGFYSGTTRGRPGPKTRAALKAYLVGDQPSTIVGKLVELARKEVGVREKPRNSNRGKRVQEFQAATWLNGTGWPWCAAFICWLCREAGMPDSARPKTASAYDFERWARKKTSPAKLIKPASKSRIQTGDIVVFTFSHIGLAVDDQDGGIVRTIEGNTDAAGSREGGGVYAKTRRVSQIRSIIRLT
jgi:hypothetical protein